MLEIAVRKHLSIQGVAFDLAVECVAGDEITVLFGPSGAGKSLTLQIIAGLVRPDEGRIALDRAPVFDSAKNIDVPAARRRIGYVFQSLALFPHLTVTRNIAYGLKNSSGEKKRRVEEILNRFGMGRFGNSLPREISGGQQQRVALARALVTEPKMLLLDEPLSALDAATKETLMQDLRRIGREQKIPILYVTHDRNEAIRLGDHMFVLDAGRIVAAGSPLAVLGVPRTETVARLAGVENILEGRVAEKNSAPGIDRIDCGGFSLLVPSTKLESGTPTTVAIAAAEILLAGEKPGMLSARNILPGIVSQLFPQHPLMLVRVECGRGSPPLLVALTESASGALSLEPGKPVWVIIKANSCHLLER